MSNWLKKISDVFIGTPHLPTDTSRGGTYSRLRHNALTHNRTKAGLPAQPADSPVWGILVETRFPEITMTIFAVNDGTTSMYLSDGNGSIGAGQRFESVRQANTACIEVANRHWRSLKPSEAFPIPEIGHTTFYALTDSGILAGDGTKEELDNSSHVLSALYKAGAEISNQLAIAKERAESEDYYNSGVAYAAKGDFDRAIAGYDKAIELNPNYVDAYINRGVAYGTKGDFDRAIAELNKAIELNPNDSYAYYNRALTYQAKSDPNHSLADYSKAIEINSKYIEAYLNRGLLYKSLERTNDAIKDFKRFLEISPDSNVRKLVEEELKKIKLT